MRLLAIALLPGCLSLPPSAAAAEEVAVRFEDVTERAGLRAPLAGFMGHGGAWGDFDGDGRLDLFVGGFADRPDAEYAPAPGPVLNRLFRNEGGGRFAAVESPVIGTPARTSGAVFVDLDNDGRLELYVANNAKAQPGGDGAVQAAARVRHSQLFRHDGTDWTDISAASGACPATLFTARNVGVLDYKGDWIIRCHPGEGKSEIVAHAPVPKHCIPCSVLDPERLIFYGGTAPGSESDPAGIQFFAYDIRARKVLYSGADGPARYLAFAPSTGRVYYTGSTSGDLMRYDPAQGGAPERLAGTIGIRAASDETGDGFLYTVSEGRDDAPPTLYALNTRTETVEALGPAAVATQGYITSLDADPAGRYLYYVPGAHGSSDRDGGAVVQFDVKTRTRKIIAFLSPFFARKHGSTLKGTYSTALNPTGDKLYITWNNSRGSKAWDSVVLTVLHIPESERLP